MNHDLASLRTHARRLQSTPLAKLIESDPARASELAMAHGPLYFNFARQTYDRQALEALIELARQREVGRAMQRLFDGEPVNVTEGRAALHTALRGDHSSAQVARDAHATAAATRARMAQLIDGLASTDVTDIVSVGIGGSDLGPRLVADALRDPLPGRFRVHFLSNVDGAAAQRTLAGLDPARTAVVLVSKTFSTQETLLNGEILRQWLGSSDRIHAVSANPGRAAAAFDIAPERVLPMWDWVGGRYSLWSAVGLPIALALGMDRFEGLLAGAAQFDQHALQAPVEGNIAVRHALTAVWNRNALGHATQGVMVYDQRLALLPAYLQQLVMESLGKTALLDGGTVTEDSVPVWWGGAGTDVQHSFFQALHQGTGIVPLDLVGTIRNDDPYAQNHLALMSNLLAQAQALANGQHSDDPHRAYAGGRPSTMILLDALTPQSLGALIAMYEHSVYVQSVLWGINAFDQYGVELGKQLASGLMPALQGQEQAADPVTRALVERLNARRPS